MDVNTKLWIHGAIAAAIGGGANTVVIMNLDPLKFNFLGGGFTNLCTAFAASAIVGLMLFLRDKPLPPVKVLEVTTTDTTVATTKTEITKGGGGA